MNLSQMRNQTRYWLDDLSGGYFTDIQVNQWLNNAQREVQKLLIQSSEYYFLKAVQTTTVVDQQDYTLPDDFLKLQRIVIVVQGTEPNEDQQSLDPITLGQTDMIGNNGGTPGAFYIKKDKLILIPTPDLAKTLKLWYTYRVQDLTADTETPDIPEEFHEFICVLAALDGLLKDGRDPTPMIEKRTHYKEMLERDAEDRIESTPRMVVESGNDGFGRIF